VAGRFAGIGRWWSVPRQPACSISARTRRFFFADDAADFVKAGFKQFFGIEGVLPVSNSYSSTPRL